MDRGYLNALAIYSLGMVGSLCSMLLFRTKAKFKVSEGSSFSTDYDKLKQNGLSSVNLAALMIIASSFVIFWNTFPDSVAIYNPFNSEIGLRGIVYEDAFFIFSISYLVILALIVNSLWYTGPKSKAYKDMHEFSKVAFSMNIIKSEYWSYYASIMPLLVFFFVVLVGYTYANAFGVSIIYLGIITFYQIIQFFQNLKHAPYYYLTILQAAKPEYEATENNLDVNISELINVCKFYGKFSNGVSLFINKIMCFTILVDSFNMHIVDHINLIDPYYLIGLVFGCIILMCVVNLDILSVNRFVQYFIHRIRVFVAQKYLDPKFEPPTMDIASDLVSITIYQQLIVLYIPVSQN